MPQTLRPFHERAFDFACEIVALYRRLVVMPDVPPSLARQLLRAGTSIGANLEEAKAAQSKRDARAKFSIALKESRETHYWLRLLVAADLVQRAVVRKVLQEAGELVAILTVARRNMEDPGSKNPR
jgi:four helix bundle protein